ncbi:MAG TPA: hypothetical protein VFR18_02835, partial [Terriglobia bacterium]|nr:hypothetical protein [Terriglobia bacterium]
RTAANAGFDSVNFEENIRRVLRTGGFELFIVGDRIRPEVALLTEILGTAANLEFSLHLMEIAFYRLHEGEDWPLIAIPTIVGKTHEVTRGVVKIRYEGKVEPEVEVIATEQDSSSLSHVDLETFLKSLPPGLDEVFQPYLERWLSSSFVLYWGQVGFSLRHTYKTRLKTIFDAYPEYMSLFLEKWLPEWGNPQ